jgi:hypothetical protein
MTDTLATFLTGAGMSPEVASSLADMVKALYQVQDGTICATVPDLVLKLVTHSSNNPELGKAFFECALQSTSQEQLVLYLCSLMCMHVDAKKQICNRLGQEFGKIQAALQSNSLYALLGALYGVCVEVESYDVQLIIAFLVHYPHAYIAHFPDCPKTNQFALYTALQNALACVGVLSNDIVTETNGEEGGMTQTELATLLLKTMEEK